MPATAAESYEISTSEVRILSVDFSSALDDDGTDETLTGTPTVTEVTTSDLVISSIQINASVVTINDVPVEIGHAVLFKVDATGATARQHYNIDIVVDTTAGQTLHGRVKLCATD